MVREHFKTIEGKTFCLLTLPNPFKIVGFEYEEGVDVEKLRSLQAMSFSGLRELKRTLIFIIPIESSNDN